MAVRLGDTLAPNGAFPAVEQHHVRGGAWSVSGIGNWTAEIAPQYRVAGMLVTDRATGLGFVLGADLAALTPIAGDRATATALTQEVSDRAAAIAAEASARASAIGAEAALRAAGLQAEATAREAALADEAAARSAAIATETATRRDALRYAGAPQLAISGTADALVGTLPASIDGWSPGADTILSFWVTATNTVANPTIAIAGQNARTFRWASNFLTYDQDDEVLPGQLLPGVRYTIRIAGPGYVEIMDAPADLRAVKADLEAQALSLNGAISAEAVARGQAISTEAAARQAGLAAEAEARATALAGEVTARNAAIATEAAARQTAISAAVAAEATARTAAIGAEADARALAVTAEKSARETAEVAAAERVSALEPFSVLGGDWTFVQTVGSGIVWSGLKNDGSVYLGGKEIAPAADLAAVEALARSASDTLNQAVGLPPALLGTAARIAVAWTTGDDSRIIGGFREDGALVHGAVAPGTTPVTLPSGDAGVVRDDGTVVRIGYGSVVPGVMQYPTRALDMRGGRMRVLHDLGTRYRVDAVELNFPWPLAAQHTQVLPYLMYGQSLALPVTSLPSLTIAGVAPTRAVMFQNGGDGAQMSVYEAAAGDKSDFGASFFPASDLDFTEPLREERGESPVSGAVSGLLPGLASSVCVVAANLARGGWSTVHLSRKGMYPESVEDTGIQYSGLLRALIRMQQYCQWTGRTLLRPIMSYVQGEADRGNYGYTYQARVKALYDALNADFRRISGGTEDLLFFTDQTAVNYLQGRTISDVYWPTGAAQLKLALDNPGRIFCVGPKYFLPRVSTETGTGDGVHLANASSRLLGEYHGRAIRQTLAGTPWVPLHVASYSRSGAVITLGVSGGDGSPLAIDETLVQPDTVGVRGFVWLQDGQSPRSVQAVTVNGRTITVTLSGDPGALNTNFTRAALCIGFYESQPYVDEGPRTGGRTNIRDTCPDTSSAGQPMFNWLCHQWFLEGPDTITPGRP